MCVWICRWIQDIFTFWNRSHTHSFVSALDCNSIYIWTCSLCVSVWSQTFVSLWKHCRPTNWPSAHVISPAAYPPLAFHSTKTLFIIPLWAIIVSISPFPLFSRYLMKRLQRFLMYKDRNTENLPRIHEKIVAEVQKKQLLLHSFFRNSMKSW